jgi:exopolyphosphatase/pppGpp-phosphohydrolase
MHLDTKVIDGVEYIQLKVFNDIIKQSNEVIDELDVKVKELKSEIFKLKHPEDVKQVQSYLLNTPSLEEKVKQYEDFLHNINMMLVSGSIKGVQKLIDHADSWSYSHRVGNGELTEEQQQELINRAFWNLNNINLD